MLPTANTGCDVTDVPNVSKEHQANASSSPPI